MICAGRSSCHSLIVFTVKMRHNIHCTITIYTNLYVLAMGNWIPYRFSRNLPLDLDNGTQINITAQFDNNSVTNATLNRAHTDQFWLLRDEDSAASSPDTIATKLQEGAVESPKPVPHDDPEWMKEYEMNELLFLSRNNCNLELQIKEWEDRKLKIQYEKLKTGMSGRCQISLYGKNGIFLAVLVSNVQLNGEKSREICETPTEILRIVTRSHHFDYTLREYDGNEEFYPVMLTESDRVHLILLFNGTNPTPERSSYNLEVFNYYRTAKNISLHDESHHDYGNSTGRVDNIYITTSVP